MYALLMFVVRHAGTLDQAVDGVRVFEHIHSDLLPGVVRAVDSLPPDVVKQVLRSLAADTDAVHTALATQVGQGVVAAVIRRGEGARDAVGDLIRGLGAQLSRLDWGLLCAAYPNCPKPEKNLLRSALGCVACAVLQRHGGRWRDLPFHFHFHRERAEAEAADNKGAQDFVTLLGR